MSWRDRYKAVLGEVNSRPSDRDREADALRTFAEESGYVPEPWTYHDALNSAGMAPVIGTPADLTNALGYATEGDWGNSLFAVAGVFGADVIAKGGKAAFKGAEELAVGVAKAINGTEPGGWQAVKEAMSPAARSYQNFAAGVDEAAAGNAYVVNGVRFDGWAAKESTLIEAKGPSYTRLLKYGFGVDNLTSQAVRQSKAAMKAGVPVIWRVQEQGAVAEIQRIVATSDATNISVVWYPMP